MTPLNSVSTVCYLFSIALKGGKKEDRTSILPEGLSTLQVDGCDGCTKTINRKRSSLYMDHIFFQKEKDRKKIQTFVISKRDISCIPFPTKTLGRFEESIINHEIFVPYKFGPSFYFFILLIRALFLLNCQSIFPSLTKLSQIKAQPKLGSSVFYLKQGAFRICLPGLFFFLVCVFQK